MNPVSLAYASVRARRLNTLLCVLASAAGIALLCAVLLLSRSLEGGLARNIEGVDVVVGAKGSPVQLILSSIYHADIPTGNIEQVDADKVAKMPQVKGVIPVALGDNYLGWHIVGTTPDYISLYGGEFADGHTFDKPFEAVAGALTGLKTGTEFAGVHGLDADGDDIHHFHNYLITGVLKPTGTVLDRLIITSVTSVQQLHMHPDADDPDGADEIKIGHQVTALLVKVKSPLAIASLPRLINQQSVMQAASPAFEMTRLAQRMGFGRDVLTALGAAFIGLSALMLLSSLSASLAARRYDLGVMRVLGASPAMLATTVVAEGMILSGAGTLFGIIAGHGFAYAVASGVKSLQGLVLPQAFLAFSAADLSILAVGLFVGFAAGIVPAVSAGRTDIAALLARGRA